MSDVSTTNPVLAFSWCNNGEEIGLSVSAREITISQVRIGLPSVSMRDHLRWVKA